MEGTRFSFLLSKSNSLVVFCTSFSYQHTKFTGISFTFSPLRMVNEWKETILEDMQNYQGPTYYILCVQLRYYLWKYVSTVKEWMFCGIFLSILVKNVFTFEYLFLSKYNMYSYSILPQCCSAELERKSNPWT